MLQMWFLDTTSSTILEMFVVFKPLQLELIPKRNYSTKSSRGKHYLTALADLNPHPWSFASMLLEKLKCTIMKIVNLKLLVLTMAF